MGITFNETASVWLEFEAKGSGVSAKKARCPGIEFCGCYVDTFERGTVNRCRNCCKSHPQTNPSQYAGPADVWLVLGTKPVMKLS